jgi:hypothetical protein
VIHQHREPARPRAAFKQPGDEITKLAEVVIAPTSTPSSSSHLSGEPQQRHIFDQAPAARIDGIRA